MKSNKVLRWVALVSVSVLGACSGRSTIGSGDEPGAGKSGNASMSGGGTKGEGATGNVGQGAVSMGATSNLGGKDPGVAGAGAKPGVERCMTDKDCPDFGAPCEPCADGTFACNKTYCASGSCVHTRDACPTKCEKDLDCPVIDIACADCGDGTVSCPTSKCQKGACQTSYPGCGNTDPCKGLSCGAMCKTTCPPDATCDANLMVGYCSEKGQCLAGIPQCANQEKCMTAKDCGTAPPVCVACGNDTCAQFECLQNTCVFACPPNPEPECTTAMDCAAKDPLCYKCEEADQCATLACIKGSCELVCPVPFK